MCIYKHTEEHKYGHVLVYRDVVLWTALSPVTCSLTHSSLRQASTQSSRPLCQETVLVLCLPSFCLSASSPSAKCDSLPS